MTTVSVIVPAYNEGPTLGANLIALAEQFAHYSCYGVQFVIVDDGSTDQTPEIIENFARYRRGVQVVTHRTNMGLGAALRSGFTHADGEYTLVVDADLSYTPALAMQLLEAIDREKGDVALASAYMRGGSVKHVPFLRRVLSREANRVLSLAARGRYATFTCMVRAYRTAFVRAIDFRANGMEANAEILLGAIRIGGAILEYPAHLEWNDARKRSRALPRPLVTARQTWATLRLAFAHRPALWLAVPGLIPGLLPLVVAVLLVFHAGARTLAIWSAGTIIIQYTSLAIFAGQLGTFFASVFSRSRKIQARRA